MNKNLWYIGKSISVYISMFTPLTEVCQDRLTIDKTANLFQQNNWPNSIWKVFNHIWRDYINCVVFCMDLLCLFMIWLRLLLIDCKVNICHIHTQLKQSHLSCGSQNTPRDTYISIHWFWSSRNCPVLLGASNPEHTAGANWYSDFVTFHFSEF